MAFKKKEPNLRDIYDRVIKANVQAIDSGLSEYIKQAVKHIEERGDSLEDYSLIQVQNPMQTIEDGLRITQQWRLVRREEIENLPYVAYSDELSPIKDKAELLSNCCSAKPLSELSEHNLGRCSDCKEMADFNKYNDLEERPVEPKEDTTEPTRYATIDGKKAYYTVEEVIKLVRAVKRYRYGMDEFNDGVDETKEKIVRELRKLK